MRVACIILAAGKSRRMGFSKSLLDIDGRASVSVIMDKLSTTSAAQEIVIVTHATDAPKLPALEGLKRPQGVQVVTNPDPERGRTGSVQVGLDALLRLASGHGSEFDGVWIWPVDTPCVEPKTLEILLQSFKRRGRSARVIPTTGESGHESAARPDPGSSHRNGFVRRRGGHPILIGRDWWSQIGRLEPDQPLRDLFAIEPDEVERVPVVDPAILWNFNTASDVERCLGRPARPLSVL